MHLTNTRINVTLPPTLAEDLRQLVGPRGKSAFIARAIEESLAKLKKEALRRKLAEGYAARREENLAMAREFLAADLEGWDEDY